MPILHIPANPTEEGQARLLPHIVYSTATGTDLTCAILTPYNQQPAKPYPAIVFVQGSAWQHPDICYQLPQLSEYARRGYVVMTVTHRNAMEGHPFPAFLEDVKTAVRYLRKSAETYHIDPERIAIFGTSSGGNTAMLVAMTANDPRYKTAEYADVSDAVCCCAECFGPTDLKALFKLHQGAPIGDALRGEQDAQAVLHDMSPYHIAEAGKAYPPVLLVQGDADPTVPWDQSERMYKKYLEVGTDAQLVCIDGAPHEGPFWSRAVHEVILTFFDAHLKK